MHTADVIEMAAGIFLALHEQWEEDDDEDERAIVARTAARVWDAMWRSEPDFDAAALDATDALLDLGLARIQPDDSVLYRGDDGW